MKKITTTIGLTALEGMLVLLPILLFILLLTEIIQPVVGLATPIADLFPAGTFDGPKHPLALALILLFGTSLLIGLALKSDTATRLGNWIQRKTLAKLPLYRFVKRQKEAAQDQHKSLTVSLIDHLFLCSDRNL